ncbi:MAG TPA: glycosyltransferase family 4 protein [Acidimicrobiales bacterium]|nr:glycosyltransferase family 4 protein [Acidimicrobiales bacterium]
MPGAASPPDRLRIAFLCYRGNPHSGGQGVYTRHLTRELVALGHEVTVFAGQPWPHLDPGVEFVPVPSLDLYRRRFPFWWPWPWQLKTSVDWKEWGWASTGQFPEAHTFSQRFARMMQGRQRDFDVIHDNQCLGRGLTPMLDDGFPLMATIHHPITVDFELELQHAGNAWRTFCLNRWYSFLPAQIEVAKRMPHVITVSESSKTDIAEQMGVPIERMQVVPVGVDHERFRPLPHIARNPDMLLTTASGDVPLKGLVPLLEALAKIRTERPAELTVIGKLRQGSQVPRTLDRLGIADAVHFVSGVSDERIVELYAECALAIVPSLYEGFSLPAIEAMASGAPLVATTGGALPEVVGDDGVAARVVPPGDAGALATAILDLLGDPAERERLAQAGRDRVLERYTWRATAEQTAEQYRVFLENRGA